MNYNETFKQIASYRNIIEQAKAELETLEQEVKIYMQEQELEELIGTEHKATYKLIRSERLDTKLLKTDRPEIFDKYTKSSETMRFSFR